MALVVPNVGEVKILDAAIAGDENLVAKLFVNDVTPAPGDTAATYTEAVGGGYADKALAKGTWNPAATSSGTAAKTYPEQTYTFSGALTTNLVIYGYYIVGAVDGVLRWAERLPASFQPASSGDAVKITPRLTLKSESDS